MPGPQPNPNALRRNNQGDWRTLPEVCLVDPPAYPFGTLSEDRADRWVELWRMPQAVIWHEQASRYLVARYFALLGVAETIVGDTKLGAEVRQLEDRLLINPDKVLRARLLVSTSNDLADDVDDDGGFEPWGDNVVSMLG